MLVKLCRVFVACNIIYVVVWKDYCRTMKLRVQIAAVGHFIGGVDESVNLEVFL